MWKSKSQDCCVTFNPKISRFSLSLALFQEYDEGKYRPRRKVTSNTSSIMLLFQNKLVFLPNIMLMDKPLLSGQPPLSGHSPVPRGWLLNRSSTVCISKFIMWKWAYSDSSKLITKQQQRARCKLGKVTNCKNIEKTNIHTQKIWGQHFSLDSLDRTMCTLHASI